MDPGSSRRVRGSNHRVNPRGCQRRAVPGPGNKKRPRRMAPPGPFGRLGLAEDSCNGGSGSRIVGRRQMTKVLQGPKDIVVIDGLGELSLFHLGSIEDRSDLV